MRRLAGIVVLFALVAGAGADEGPLSPDEIRALVERDARESIGLFREFLGLPNDALQAQDEAQAPEAFVPSERLPADSAVSFPVDI